MPSDEGSLPDETLKSSPSDELCGPFVFFTVTTEAETGPQDHNLLFPKGDAIQ